MELQFILGLVIGVLIGLGSGIAYIKFERDRVNLYRAHVEALMLMYEIMKSKYEEECKNNDMIREADALLKDKN